MKKVVSLFLACLLSGCIASSADWQRVDVEEFNQAIEENENAFLLDVRTQTEWEQDGHLENATLVPHSELEAREGELPSEKDTMILLYCRSGNRSQDAAQTLIDLGFTNIIELETGINGWKDAGMPVSYE
ncbi:rhodanese-like domain-containing protein [Candidatus Poseidoniales archaeon]|jgi:phage shock protein E|nr:rhodanese-like domain-containing protein [Candidatus Poseidoniales archaeon]MDB4758598.1 rhodanese-like domain-containing protein [Candidatus Poseidoniaceae archaeon]MDA8556360.1 rhodanese-like domain-containing protein [Candidatus Poseidoniales archaeon]MDA8615958.1 rhodanese-like domain-containing protein [Candidatus Poseidoniales archaeon]MDA8673332.1 rhodanese-like domain-containing protein [Candidatus Poseidoniales archaeon]